MTHDTKPTLPEALDTIASLHAGMTIADDVLALINSQVRTPTREEIGKVVADGLIKAADETAARILARKAEAVAAGTAPENATVERAVAVVSWRQRVLDVDIGKQQIPVDVAVVSWRQRVLDLAERAAKARHLRNRLEVKCFDDRKGASADVGARVALDLAEFASAKLDRELRDEVGYLSADDLLTLVADVTNGAIPDASLAC